VSKIRDNVRRIRRRHHTCVARARELRDSTPLALDVDDNRRARENAQRMIVRAELECEKVR
jgi:hypothetical protein